MKKLLVLAAVVIVGIAANAASFKWSAANIYGANGTDKYTGDVTLYAYAAGADVSTAFAVSTVKATAAGAIAQTTFSNDNLVDGLHQRIARSSLNGRGSPRRRNDDFDARRQNRPQ